MPEAAAIIQPPSIWLDRPQSEGPLRALPMDPGITSTTPPNGVHHPPRAHPPPGGDPRERNSPSDRRALADVPQSGGAAPPPVSSLVLGYHGGRQLCRLPADPAGSHSAAQDKQKLSLRAHIDTRPTHAAPCRATECQCPKRSPLQLSSRPKQPFVSVNPAAPGQVANRSVVINPEARGLVSRR